MGVHHVFEASLLRRTMLGASKVSSLEAEAWASADELLHIWDYHGENPKAYAIGHRRCEAQVLVVPADSAIVSVHLAPPRDGVFDAQARRPRLGATVALGPVAAGDLYQALGPSMESEEPTELVAEVSLVGLHHKASEGLRPAERQGSGFDCPASPVEVRIQWHKQRRGPTSDSEAQVRIDSP